MTLGESIRDPVLANAVDDKPEILLDRLWRVDDDDCHLSFCGSIRVDLLGAYEGERSV